MSRRHIYQIWRGEGHPWAAWVKWPLFDHIEQVDEYTKEEGIPREHNPIAEENCDTSWLVECAAVVIDLPATNGIKLGLALGKRGLRPVLAINACSAQIDVIDMRAAASLLVRAAHEVDAFPNGPNLAPAFILDARRFGQDLAVVPGMFDNRWVLFASDLPRAIKLQQAGITKIIVVQVGESLNWDLEAILCDYQQHGLTILLRDITSSRQLVQLKLRSRSWLRRLEEGIRRRLSFSRRQDGSFGEHVPFPPEPTHG